MQQGPAERQPLQHPARVRAGALVTRIPEREALEQHPDPLARLGHSIEARVEPQVLDRRELAVHERLVAEEPELPALDVYPSSPAVGAASPATRRSRVVLPEPFGR